jgi:flagellar hook-associated protein 1 FlgK
MTDLLSIGASGVRASQAALTAVSENIAGAGVAGFSRRTVTSDEIAVGAARGVNGYGVAVTGVSRAADQIKAGAVRAAGTDLARTEAGSVWLDRIQSALTGADLGTRVTDFFTGATALAADPTSTAQRSVMLEQAATVAAGFSATGAALAQVTADLDATAAQDVGKVDALAEGLAKVNAALSRATPGSAGAAGLADQRDRLLEEMSGLVDVTATFDAAGRATVKLGGATLVQGSEAGRLGYARNAEGQTAFAVTFRGETTQFAPAGGSLAGVADAAGRVAEARVSLDDMARDFASGINAVQAGGTDLNGAAGAAMFAYDAKAPTQMTLALADPAGIAAAKGGAEKNSRDASNLAALQSLRAADGYETRLTTMVAGNAAAIRNRATVADAQTAILEGATAARDAATGVNIDNEAVDLLRFQQAYQASSRVIQAAKDIFQSILEIR